MLNATMLAPAIRDINSQLGPNAYTSMSSYFYLAGAIGNVVLIRWSDYIGRKRVLLGILIMLCIGTLLCIVGTSLPVVVAGRTLQGGSNITFGLAFLIMRERLSAPVFGVCCGVISAVNSGVAGIDALLGGFLVDRFGYRSIFVLTLVIGVAVVALSWKAVPADQPGRAASGRMDWVGAALIAVTVAGIDLFLANGGHLGWSSPVRARVCRGGHRRARGVRRGREARGATSGPHRSAALALCLAVDRRDDPVSLRRSSSCSASSSRPSPRTDSVGFSASAE